MWSGFGRGVLSQPTRGFGRAPCVPPVGSGAPPVGYGTKPQPQTHFLHILGHKTLLAERKNHFQLSSAAWTTNTTIILSLSSRTGGGGQLPLLPPLSTPLIHGYVVSVGVASSVHFCTYSRFVLYYKSKVTWSHNWLRALDSQLIPVSWKSSCRWLSHIKPRCSLQLLYTRPAVTFQAKQISLPCPVVWCPARIWTRQLDALPVEPPYITK